jgi:hypothetical protein
MEELFRVLAADLVPERPGRREPRAVKRRPKPYPRLMRHRRSFREIPHQNRYYKNSRFGRKYCKLMGSLTNHHSDVTLMTRLKRRVVVVTANGFRDSVVSDPRLRLTVMGERGQWQNRRCPETKPER